MPSTETERELARGAALFDVGAYWEAHEVWEHVWRAETDAAQRTALQGLIQVAAALHKLVDKADVDAGRRLLARGLAKLEEAGAALDGPVAVDAFVAQVRELRAAVDRDDAFDRHLVPRFAAGPPPRRRFVVVGQTATASADFSLDDIPSTSGRLDVMVRCLRASLLVSHGVRRDTVVYLVLLGGPRAPRALRVDGADARFLRPDERSLATLVKKALAHDAPGPAFVTVRPGVAIARGGLDAVLGDLGPASFYVLEESARDVREVPLERPVFFVGDHRGFDRDTRARISELHALAVSVGPLRVHADDAIAILANELDRRAFQR